MRILARDLELAHRLGFTIVRPKLGVVSLDLLPDPVWREAVKRVLPKAEELRHPDRAGDPRADAAPVEDRRRLPRASSDETGTEHFGLLIDTGIFQTGDPRPRDHSDSV